VRNVSVAVREHKGEIVFLRQVVPGGANKSYGIDVARLAGLPPKTIARARQIMGQLEGGSQLGTSAQLALAIAAPAPLAGSRTSLLVEKLESIDPHDTTPMQALALLAELKKLL
jgi:DNA mismatch repair protein MutS